MIEEKTVEEIHFIPSYLITYKFHIYRESGLKKFIKASLIPIICFNFRECNKYILLENSIPFQSGSCQYQEGNKRNKSEYERYQNWIGKEL